MSLISHRILLSVTTVVFILTLNVILVKQPIYSQAQLEPVNPNISGNNNNTTSLQSNNIVSVSILPGAGALGEKAFSPNPVNITGGETVIWTNDDDSSPAFHTVTSGKGANDTNFGDEFDSGLVGSTALLTKGTKFSHTFEDRGEFPYFCQLHPTMIGKVIVS